METNNDKLLAMAKHNLEVAKEQLEKYQDNDLISEDTKEIFKINYQNAVTNYNNIKGNIENAKGLAATDTVQATKSALLNATKAADASKNAMPIQPREDTDNANVVLKGQSGKDNVTIHFPESNKASTANAGSNTKPEKVAMPEPKSSPVAPKRSASPTSQPKRVSSTPEPQSAQTTTTHPVNSAKPTNRRKPIIVSSEETPANFNRTKPIVVSTEKEPAASSNDKAGRSANKDKSIIVSAAKESPSNKTKPAIKATVKKAPVSSISEGKIVLSGVKKASTSDTEIVMSGLKKAPAASVNEGDSVIMSSAPKRPAKSPNISMTAKKAAVKRVSEEKKAVVTVAKEKQPAAQRVNKREAVTTPDVNVRPVESTHTSSKQKLSTGAAWRKAFKQTFFGSGLKDKTVKRGHQKRTTASKNDSNMTREEYWRHQNR